MNVLIWILSSCVLILAVLIIRALFARRLRPGLRYALWALVLARLLIPGSFWTSPVSVGSAASGTELARELTALEGVESLSLSPDGRLTGTLRESVQTPARPAGSPAPSAAGSGVPDKSVTIAENATEKDYTRMNRALTLRNVAETVWVTGSVAVLAIFIATNIMFYVNLCGRRRKLDGDYPIRVYEVDGLESSCYFLGAVYINSEAAADELTLRHVLAHELSHRRHLDGLWTLLRCAALTVHWFNPLVWLAASRSRQDSELFADAGALRHLREDERESYGGTLISLSVHAPRTVSPLCAATAMAGGRKSLRERVELIARRPRATIAVLLAVTFIAGIAVGCTFAGAALESAPADDGGEVKNDTPTPGQTVPDGDGNLPAGTEPAGTEPSEPPQTPNVAVYESEGLGAAILYPAEWDDYITLSDSQTWEGFISGQSDPVPCVRIDLQNDILGFQDTPGTSVYDAAVTFFYPSVSVYDYTVAFLYWRPAGQTGPEAEYGESVTLYAAGDGSELVCFLPMNAKLNWTGDDAGAYDQRIYDAYDTVERGILDGKLSCRSVDALRQLTSLPLRDLFDLGNIDNTGGYNEFALTQLIDRFLADPLSFLTALAEEPEELQAFITVRMGTCLYAWYPTEARTCFDGLAGEALDPRQAKLLDAIVSAYDAYTAANSPADLSDLAFDEPYLDRFAGVTMELLYEDEKSIIFVGESGVWGYDLREERITFGIDLLKVFNSTVYFQGDPDPYSVYAEASADGTELVLSCAYRGTTDDPDRERETYYIDVPTLTYRKGEYRRLDDPFNSEDAVGTIIPGFTVGGAKYIRGDKTYELFK